MRLRSSPEQRRARPLLGTIVELSGATTERQFSLGFAAIEKVQRLMSFYDPASDVARVNRARAGAVVRVDRWTWKVLRLALTLAQQTEGAFDVARAHTGRSDWNDLELESGARVRLRRRVQIDLGGIAKGFAVDRAVAALRRDGVTDGVVNAGGDLRVFGPRACPVHLRHPAEPVLSAGMVVLRERAMATSGSYFAPEALRHGQNALPLRSDQSASVAAKNCVVADALTKVVLILGERAKSLLRQYSADAVVLDRSGSIHWTFQSHAA